MATADARWATIYGAWQASRTVDGMSDTGDAPVTEMKEGPGPSARDPARRAPAPIRGQGTEKGSEESSLLISFDCAEEQ